MVVDVLFMIELGEWVLLFGVLGVGKLILFVGFVGVLGGDDEGEWKGMFWIDGVVLELCYG